ncbi:MAG TPA: branched-chain amino acid ABC transporter permease [Spirochaetes bacterium]|nr:branched-chain amino acid ABC transporter permease [Spirochaetota bacterium]
MKNKYNNMKIAGLIILAAVLLSLPFVLGAYYHELIIMLYINIIVVVSFRMIAVTGGWSLAHIPLMGVGAYAAALMSKHFGFPFWATLPLGGLASAFVAFIMSYPLLRMKGFSFFIGSYAAGEAVRLSWIRFRNPFGGPRGLIGIPSPGIINISGTPLIDFSNDVPFYILTLAITVIILILLRRFDRSRIGNTLKAISSSDRLAKSVGINITYYKALAFILASFFNGIAGVLLAHRLGTIDPHQFGFTSTLYLLLWAIIGGTTTFAGPIIGISALTLIGELIRRFNEWVPMIYGVILIITVIFLPEGLESLPKKMPGFFSKLMFSQKSGTGADKKNSRKLF